MAKRRIGLGVTGLADALIMCNVRYGTPPAIALTDSGWRAQGHAYVATAELAAKKALSRCSTLKVPGRANARTLDADVREAIAKHGIRNGLLTSIAPTGTSPCSPTTYLPVSNRCLPTAMTVRS